MPDDHGRRTPRRGHADPPRGAGRRLGGPRGREHDAVHCRLPGLHHPHRVGRSLAAAGPAPARAQHRHAVHHHRAAALGRVRAARARGQEQRPVRRGHRRGHPARRGLRRGAGREPRLQGGRPDPGGAARGMSPVPPRNTGMLLAGVLLAGLNLRLSIAAVSPVLPQIRAELHLSATLAGLLTTLPVLCFAAFAPVAAWFGRRVGAERAVLAGLVLLGAATAGRVLDGAPVLLAGTVLLGAAMAVGNVLLPPVVKREFGPRAGTVTGLYTGTFTIGATATAALTAPLAAVWGWRAALACWAVLAVVAVGVWGPATRGNRKAAGQLPDRSGAGPRVWRSRLAWAVSGALALQTALCYAVTAWLPSLLADQLARGGAAAGASAASLFQLLGIPGTLLVPLLVRRSTGERGLGLAVAAGWAVLVRSE